jgi:hypothetical protein
MPPTSYLWHHTPQPQPCVISLGCFWIVNFLHHLLNCFEHTEHAENTETTESFSSLFILHLLPRAVFFFFFWPSTIIVYGVLGPYEKLCRVIIKAVGLMIKDSISATTMVSTGLGDPRPWALSGNIRDNWAGWEIDEPVEHWQDRRFEHIESSTCFKMSYYVSFSKWN